MDRAQDRAAGEIDPARLWRTDEVPSAGRYQCVACGTRLDVVADEPLPRCPHCHGTEFHRVHD